MCVQSLGNKGAVIIFGGDGDEIVGGDVTVTDSEESAGGINIDGDVGLAGDSIFCSVVYRSYKLLFFKEVSVTRPQTCCFNII